jgi:protein-S-isoprenylcysteine O-methyltransferase Ste14
MPVYAYIILAVGTAVWLLPLMLRLSKAGVPQRLDRRARWGVVLVGIGYSLLWQWPFWTRSPGAWRIASSVICFIAASIFSWSAARALGRHLRIDAGLSADHSLVKSGIYGLVRHPVYTSLLLVIIATGLIVAPVGLFVAALAAYLVGTEIRVRIEDGLLASRFGEEFRNYRASVPAYIPIPKIMKAK